LPGRSRDHGPRARSWLRHVAALGAAASVAALGACGGSGDSAASRAGATVRVTVEDFNARESRTRVPAGPVTFDVHNRGPSTHEFVLARTDLPSGKLPLRPDGLSVNEDAAALHEVGSVDDLGLGNSRRVTVNLRPGHYVLYCNFEGHYLGGIHADLEVTGASS
jgi:uncharacterized cupredoxin-like copper-binding protein